MKFAGQLNTLVSRIQLVTTQNGQDFDQRKKTKGAVTITVCAESELADKTTYANLHSLYAEVKTKQLYVWDTADGVKGCYFIQKESPKKLDSAAPGKTHLASAAGANCAAGLLSHAALDKRTNVCLEFSAAAKASLGDTLPYFCLSLWQRGGTNRVFKTESPDKPKTSFEIALAPDMLSSEQWNKVVSLHQSMTLTRSLINMPPNLLRPDSYENIARETAASIPGVTFDVVHAETLKDLGCGLITAVGKGSDVGPRILKLQYNGSAQNKHIALVGKGITFDSGGYDIKTSATMRNMKKDMGGSAAVLGIFTHLAEQKINAKVTCYLAVAENMVSGAAMRPGDVYKARNGLQVEIDNTDAEGRLVLADAICLVNETKPDWIIDIATLTGAARVAMGPMVDPIFSNSSSHAELLYKAGIEIGDWFWQMPLVDDYDPMFDSTVADFTNCSTSGLGGAITAAQFIKKFVDKTPWTHVDSFMWSEKAADMYNEAGAAAKCVRAVSSAIEKFVQEKA